MVGCYLTHTLMHTDTQTQTQTLTPMVQCSGEMLYMANAGGLCKVLCHAHNTHTHTRTHTHAGVHRNTRALAQINMYHTHTHAHTHAHTNTHTHAHTHTLVHTHTHTLVHMHSCVHSLATRCTWPTRVTPVVSCAVAPRRWPSRKTTSLPPIESATASSLQEGFSVKSGVCAGAPRGFLRSAAFSCMGASQWKRACVCVRVCVFV